MGIPSIHAIQNSDILVIQSEVKKKEGNKVGLLPTTKKPVYISPRRSRGRSKKYSVKDIDQLVSEELNIPKDNYNNNDTMDIEGDICMSEIDNEDELQQISNYLADQRDIGENIYGQNIGTLSMEDNDSAIPMMVPTSMKTIFVIDTNFIISHLSSLEGLRQLAQKFHHQIVIPNTVIRELDGLKHSNREVQRESSSDQNSKQSIGPLARWANDWIYKNLANRDSGVMGQKLRQRIDPNCIKDDGILDCSLYFRDMLNCFVILLSNDKNLCLKALTEEIPTVSQRKNMTAELIATKAYEENVSRFGFNNPEHGNTETQTETQDVEITQEIEMLNLSESAPYLFEEVQNLVKLSIEYAMNEEYGDDLELIGYERDKVKNLMYCSSCLFKFWLSVFSEYFRKSNIKRESWKDLPSCLVEIPTTVSDLSVFVQFWKDILKNLFFKRDYKAKHELENIFKHWDDLVKRSK